MKLSPDMQSIIQKRLSRAVGDDYIESLMDMEHMIRLVQRGDFSWQVACSIAVHASVLDWSRRLFDDLTEDDSALLRKLTSATIEPLEAVVSSLTSIQARSLWTKNLFISYSMFALPLGGSW